MRSIPRRRSVLGVVAVLAALSLVACSNETPAPIPAAHGPGAPPERGGTLTTASFADIRTIDPANIADGIVPEIDQALFAGLIDFDESGRIVPSIAERWVVEDGGRTYRFFMRPGVKFHDGDEVTADDVRRSVERALHPSAPNPYAAYYASIAGFDDFQAKKTDHLAGVVVEGRYVVTFHLKEADATFLPLLAMAVLRPVCKSAGDRYVDTWAPCGAGPFKLEPGGWDHGRSVTLVRHDGYFEPGLPRLDRLTFLFHVNLTAQREKLVRGDIDVLRDFLAPDLAKFLADPRWSPFGKYEPDRQVSGEAMNVEMPPFDNVEIRRAVAAAIDRDVIRLIRPANLLVADQPIPPAIPGHDPALVGQHYDYAAALEHMKRAGYPYDPVTKTGGWPKPIPYLVYKQGLHEFTAQVVAQQLEKIGIHLDLHLVNYPTFIALRGRRKQTTMAPAFWNADYQDALSFLEPLWGSKAINDEDSNNWSFYRNPRIDEIIADARHETDDAARMSLYHEASRILCDDAPWAFDFYYRFYIQHQPYVREFRSHPTASYDFSRAWIDRADRGASAPHARAAFSFDPRDALGSILGAGAAR